MVKKALWVMLEAKPGKEATLAEFLKSAQPLAENEPATAAWFALQLGPSTFGIFDVFPDDEGRDTHLSGPIAAALMSRAAELLAKAPKIERIDVIAAKLKS